MSIQPILSDSSMQWKQTDSRCEESAAKIHRALQEANHSFFFPRSLQLDLLKNRPETVPTLAQWLYEEWHSYDTSLSVEKLIDSLNKRQNDNQIPIAFVVVKNAAPVGLIALKEQSDPEFSDFPQNILWMGSFHIAPEERNKGLGKGLLKFATDVAAHLGYKEIFFYTSNPLNVTWYFKNGASLIEERSFRDHKVTIMKMSGTV
jgi:predicted N-acetyltransferase YhbS